MNVQLLHTTSENNAVNKKFSNIATVSATMKDNSSILHPVLVFSFNAEIYNVNYLYIEEWKRYYFIRDIAVLTGGRYQITADVDALESFRSDILKLSIILDNTQNTGKNNYLQSDVFERNCKNSTIIGQFPSGLSESGEFILITAGG